MLQDKGNNSIINDTQTFQINAGTKYLYQKPKPFEFIKNGLMNIGTLSTMAVQKENMGNLGMVAASTLLMISLDQQIVDEAKNAGRKLNISGDNYLKTYVAVNDFPIFQGPTNLGSSLYFLGDGWTHSAIAFSFLGFGLFKNDYRALQTFNQIAEGMIATGSTTQFLKHITGRESPFVATAPGGKWDFFPDQVEYHKHVPQYDAYPSGHLATAMMTYTVIKENYPEKRYVRPIGLTLLTLLSFQMLNNEVHWISDYPLALIMGYASAKTAVNRGRKVVTNEDNSNDMVKNNRNSLHIQPLYHYERGFGLALRYQF